VAALMPTAMTDTAGQQVLSTALYEGVFALDKRILGQAVAYAKQQLLANGGCFTSAAGLDLSSELLMPLAAMALLICLIWISRRRRG